MTYVQQLADAFPKGAVVQMGEDTADSDGDRSSHHVAALHALDDSRVVMWDSDVGLNRIFSPSSYEVVNDKPLLVRTATDIGSLEIRGEDDPGQVKVNAKLQPVQAEMVRSMRTR